MMRLGMLMDSLAERLLDLRQVSGTQWLLRGIGVLAAAGAFAAAHPEGPSATVIAVVASLCVAASLLVQVFVPDTDVGVLAPGAILMSMAGRSELTVMHAATVGVTLLVAHMAWSLAATVPAHGVFTASAWVLTCRSALTVLALSALGAVLVVLLSGISLGPWMIAVGVLAAIALVVGLLPREEG